MTKWDRGARKTRQRCLPGRAGAGDKKCRKKKSRAGICCGQSGSLLAGCSPSCRHGTRAETGILSRCWASSPRVRTCRPLPGTGSVWAPICTRPWGRIAMRRRRHTRKGGHRSSAAQGHAAQRSGAGQGAAQRACLPDRQQGGASITKRRSEGFEIRAVAEMTGSSRSTVRRCQYDIPNKRHGTFCTQKNRRTGFPVRRQHSHLWNGSLCVPVRASVSTSILSSMR